MHDTNMLAEGIHRDLPAEQYHLTGGISSSDLKFLLNWTPEHLKDRWQQRSEQAADGAPEPTTVALTFGKAYHCALLEPERFAAEYYAELDADDLTASLDTAADLKAACKERDLKVSGTKADLVGRLLDAEPLIRIRSEMERQHDESNVGKTFIKATDMLTIGAMRERVMSHEKIAQILLSGEPEVSMVWKDPETEVICKIRPDWVRLVGDLHVIFDLKTTLKARSEDFARSVYQYGYHVSAAMYLDGYNAVVGHEAEFILGVQEKHRPFVPAADDISPEDLALGRRQYRRALRQVADCMNNETWPGYGNGIRTVALPAYARIERDTLVAA